jgi:hypothetical protein
MNDKPLCHIYENDEEIMGKEKIEKKKERGSEQVWSP